MMKLIAIETSTNLASVAVTDGKHILSEQHLEKASHAKVVLPLIENLLAKMDLSLSNIDAIAYGMGPGSFTGVRIATSMAKGLALANDLPLIPISSLAAIAHKAHQKTAFERIIAACDARMQEIYWACYQCSADAMNVCQAETLSAPQDVKTHSPYLLAGCGLEEYAIPKHFTRFEVIYPDAHSIIELAKNAQHRINAAEAKPMYLRNKVTGN
jgi:tRNA threonylcarbamoyladenosine biosynthesis protein TsaB